VTDGAIGSNPDTATVTVTVTGTAGGFGTTLAPGSAFVDGGPGELVGIGSLALQQPQILGADVPIA
jgi:hypothetical protein